MIAEDSKKKLREQALRARRALPAGEREALSAQICTHLANCEELAQHSVIAGFSPMHDEVDITNFAELTIKSGRTYCLPRVTGKHEPLAMHKIGNISTDLVTGYGGILEPRPNLESIDLAKIGAALIPASSVDLQGNRLGFGLAFYDITIALMSVQTMLISPIFSVQQSTSITAEKHDRKVHLMVTEDGLLDFRQ